MFVYTKSRKTNNKIRYTKILENLEVGIIDRIDLVPNKK